MFSLANFSSMAKLILLSGNLSFIDPKDILLTFPFLKFKSMPIPFFSKYFEANDGSILPSILSEMIELLILSDKVVSILLMSC